MSVNRPNVDIVHQDDDGFESLNGNVSSDNDRASIQRTAIQQIDDNQMEGLTASTSSDERLVINDPTSSESSNIKKTTGLFRYKLIYSI